MKKNKIYLSGRITGNANYKKEFEEAKKIVMCFFSVGHYDVINPAELSFEKNTTHSEYMHRDIKLLLDCRYLVDIENGSEKSKGACLERTIAKATGIYIYKLSSIKKACEEE